MLTAISLSDKLGDKGLVALSLHPGVIMTNLGTHLDWNTDWPALSKFKHVPTGSLSLVTSESKLLVTCN